MSNEENPRRAKEGEVEVSIREWWIIVSGTPVVKLFNVKLDGPVISDALEKKEGQREQGKT